MFWYLPYGEMLIHDKIYEKKIVQMQNLTWPKQIVITET